jgi:hypothetical protein
MAHPASRSTVLTIAVSVAALSVVGTSAYAAGRITGSDLKDKTLGPDDVLVRVAAKQNDGPTLTGVTGPQTALSVSITAPTKGYLVVEGSSDVHSSAVGSFAQCFITLDDHYVLGSYRTIGLDASSGNAEEDCITGVTFPVAAGKHKVRLRAVIPHITTVFDKTALSAQFVPFNGQGKRPSKAEITAALEQ